MLIVCAIGMVGLVEGATRLALDRVSRIQRRTADEYRGAAAMGPRNDGRTRVLMVGNSLLLEDVDFDRVRETMRPDTDVRRFVVEQTYFHDWYYGLRRLLEEGARPDVVVVMISPRDWTRTQTRGDYFAHYLMRASDAIPVSRELGLHPTVASSLVLARASKFWGARSEIRNFLLGRLMPDLPRLLERIKAIDPTHLSDEEVAQIAGPRLDRFRRLLEEYRAALVVIVPPLLDPYDGSRGFRSAAAGAGVPVIQPLTFTDLSAADFRDAGHHLNPAGASGMTTRLLPALRAELNRIVASRARAERTGSDGSADTRH